jgi:hypothetical protein
LRELVKEALEDRFAESEKVADKPPTWKQRAGQRAILASGGSSQALGFTPRCGVWEGEFCRRPVWGRAARAPEPPRRALLCD